MYDAAAARQAADRILHAVAAETSVAQQQNCSPMLYAGLRLLQLGSSSMPHEPSSSTSVKPAAAPSEASGNDELARALRELEDLRQQLHRAEVAEAVHAAKVIALASEGQKARAARTIQAGFHGYMARAWVRELHAAADEEMAAATAIQASWHGATARRMSRELTGAGVERQSAATAIQATFHGASARRTSRELNRDRVQRQLAAITIQAGLRGRVARDYRDAMR